MSKSLPAARAPRVHVSGLRRFAILGAVVALFVAAFAPAHVFAATYNPLLIISDDNWRAGTSLSQAEIQAFLETQAGVLKSYSCAEGGPNGLHSQVVKPASQIIAEAAQYWSVNPKLILATLQKEQSLITAPYHVASSGDKYGTDYHLMYAMGAGVYPGSPDKHPGFGDQVWTGTQKLGQTTGAYAWYPGKKKTVTIYSWDPNYSSTHTTMTIVPLNQPTWNSYTYTPYYPQKTVWTWYTKFFDDPLAPPAQQPVHRFYNKKLGTHFYTASELERYTVLAKLGSTYGYEGVAYRVNTLNAANSVPLHRFLNVKKGVHFYTAFEAEKDAVIKNLSGTFKYEGVAYKVSLTTDGGTPVYRFLNVRQGTHLYTVSESEKATIIAMLGATYRYEGIGYYLAP